MEGIHIDKKTRVISIDEDVPLDTVARFLDGLGEDHGWEIRICKGGDYGTDENTDTSG